MAESPYIADVGRADFAARVVEQSHKLPVLVDFWAPWCGPCRMLGPILERLTIEYGGKVFLAKVNTDIEQELAARYHIRGIPAVKLFRNGDVVDEFVGVQPEPVIRSFLERHVPSETDQAIERARSLAQAGNTDDAAAALQQVLEGDPNNDRAKLALAEVRCLQAAEGPAQDRLQECEQLLDSLSIRMAANPEVDRLRFLVGLRRTAARSTRADAESAVAADPDDLGARYRLAAHLALAEQYEAAMDHLLEIVRRDRKFEDDAGRKAMVGIFHLLGHQHPAVVKYRGMLSRTLA